MLRGCAAFGLGILAALLALFVYFSTHLRPPEPPPVARGPQLIQWHDVPELQASLAQFQSVFWDPKDTDSMRHHLLKTKNLDGMHVLEIGTGTGLLAFCYLQSNAARVVATDINPAAIANAAYNADRLGYSSRAEWILADRTEPAFAPLSRARGVAEQRFDVILSNPPWESKSTSADLPDQYALYDPNWILLDEILERSANHLAPNGELLLAYGAKEPILRILDRGPALGWTIAMLDERSLDDLPEVFLPGMLIRLTRSAVE